jgi:hypothetical protein
MKSYILALTILIALTGCGKAGSQIPHTQSVSIDSEFTDYVQRFQDQAAEQGTPIQITDLQVYMVPSIPKSVGGICTTSLTNAVTPSVQISQIIWDDIDDTGKEELIFHELGHCLLKRVHRWDVSNGVPLSIMSPGAFASPLYQVNKNQYYYELFHNQDLDSALPMYAPFNVMLPVLDPNSAAD